MGYKCDVCEAEEGAVFCFADEAVLCRQCDDNVHGGTKAAQKHERVSLSTGNSTNLCDICQEQNAVMFCSEDRALICRRCDLMIHTANAHTAKHHRLLLVGMDVGLNALPLPGEAGRTEEGTSRRLRRNQANQATTSAAPASAYQAAPSSRRAEANQLGGRAHMASAPSSGSLIHTAPVASQGASALLSPFEAPGAFPHPFGSEDAAALPTGGAFAPALPWQDRGSSMTLAAELLGVPSVSNGFTAKDIDAAYMLGGSGDLDAGLSALLEVPDFDARSPVSAEDFIGSLAQQPLGVGLRQRQADGVVPDLFSPAAKRQRAA